MGRPIGTKNVMRSPEEKEKIIKEYYSSNIGRNAICKKYDISTSTLRKWREQYESCGLVGLKSNTGKSSYGKGLHLKKPKKQN